MHDGLRDHLTRTEICPFRASLTLLACAMRVQLARLERFLKHGAALPLFGASGEIRLILTGRCGRSWRSDGGKKRIWLVGSSASDKRIVEDSPTGVVSVVKKRLAIFLVIFIL